MRDAQACVMEGEAMSIMCSYNAVNGVPARMHATCR
jgi:beta-glucosidase-like glycosyl hydrolase